MKKRSCIKVIVFFMLVFMFTYGEEKAVYFLQISDTHFGFENNLSKLDQKRHYAKYRNFVRTINEFDLDIKFLAITGDITNRGCEDVETLDKYLGYFEKIKYPIHYLAGNHDIDPNYPEEMEEKYKKFKDKFGDISYVKEYNGVRFIFMYAQTLRGNVSLKDYDAILWLKEQLEQNQNQETIILMHTVPGTGFYEGKIYEAWNQTKEKEFEEIIKNYNIKAIIGGHVHNSNYGFLGDVPVITAPEFMSYDGAPYPYRLYKYENGKLSFYSESIK